MRKCIQAGLGYIPFIIVLCLLLIHFAYLVLLVSDFISHSPMQCPVPNSNFYKVLGRFDQNICKVLDNFRLLKNISDLVFDIGVHF